MGYTTKFHGEFTLDKPLTDEHRAYLQTFAETRRMKRDATLLKTVSDNLRNAAGLPVGPEGAYYVGSTADFGQKRTPDVIDYNVPPTGQPGLWCHWIPNEAGTAIQWNGGEKFYNYVKWLEYLIENFLKPWGYVLNGEVEWTGEDSNDRGKLVAKNNKLTVKRGHIVYR